MPVMITSEKSEPMNPEIKALWVAALRSGEYEQCRGALTRVDCMGGESYCCLGVLSKLGVDAGVTRRSRERWEDKYWYGPAVSWPEDRGSSGLPPMAVSEWAGLAESNPHVEYDGNTQPLSVLNDTLNLSLAEIADVIEAQL